MNDSKLAELARLIDEWPGLVSAPADELIADCLVLVSHVSDATTLVDIGSGGGLPGLPLKIMVPRLEVTLVEADGRKAAFLTQACVRKAALRPSASTSVTSSRGTMIFSGSPGSPPPDPMSTSVVASDTCETRTRQSAMSSSAGADTRPGHSSISRASSASLESFTRCPSTSIGARAAPGSSRS